MNFRPITSLAIILWLASSASADDGAAIRQAMEGLYDLPLDTATTYDVQTLEITHEDMSLRIDSGRIAFYAPVSIDGVSHVCGAYAEGKVHLTFSPSPAWEKGQLKRFYKDSSVQFDAREVALFFTDAIRMQIVAAGKPAAQQFDAGTFKRGKKVLDRLEHYDKDKSFRFETLQSLLHPSDRPYLMVALDPNDFDFIFYKFNPLEQEEVEYYKSFKQPGIDYMEPICEYSQHSLKAGIGINGLNKDRLTIQHYALDGSINPGGRYVGSARVSITTDSTLRAFAFDLNVDLKVDSVLDASGRAVAFARYKDDADWYRVLYLFLDSTLQPGTSTDVVVYYNGDIAKREVGEFFVSAGSDWYPFYNWGQATTFDMSFKTPKRFAFVSCGEKVKDEIIAETLYTSWKITDPTKYASFAIGNLKKYQFTDSLAGVVDVYKNTELESTGRHMEKQVGDDIVNAVRLFIHRFGQCPYPHLCATEFLALRGEAYPAFLQLSTVTFDRTDEFGDMRFFRAHETAHQWWGIGVRSETYHDYWLSEGLATYSGLMYLQAVEGNDMFLNKLKAYRKEITGVRNYIFGSGAEAGPIILGPRTSSSKTAGDYDLIIYQKGALVFHMLRNMMMDLRNFNEDRFIAMMKDYYDTYRGKNATTADFKAIVEKHVGEDMGWFFDQWVYGTDIPTIDFTYTIEPADNNTFTAKCKMVTKDVPANFFAYVPVEIQIDDKAKAYVRVALDKPVTEFTLPRLPRKPKALKLNPFESVLADVNQ